MYELLVPMSSLMYKPGTDLQKQAYTAPARPGVYLMIGGGGEILYVGKAKNLKNRVSSYFQKRLQDGKTAHLVSRIQHFETIITDNEAEALILENNLIKKHQPRYNIELKENESYPYLKITNETFPRILKTRIRRNDGARYFGPYTSAGSVNRTLRTIAENFPVRRCRERLDHGEKGKKPRPCLNYTIGRCPGPCSGRITPEEYADLVEQVVLFLKGRSNDLLTRIREEMRGESEARNYEQALRLRERYRALQQLVEEQKITTGDGEDEDILGMAGQEGIWVITVMARRNGRITGKWDYTARGGTDERNILEEFLSLHYGETEEIPRRVLLPFPIRDESMLRQYVRRKHGRPLQFVVPGRGMNRKLVSLAALNAAHALREAAVQNRKSALQELKRVLRLDRVPRVIESFDVATLLGDHSVAGMARFAEGSFDKRHYRKFRIRYTPERGDVDMLKEAVARRYQRLINEEGRLPDLVLVDGGKPQVNGTRAVLETLGLHDLPVVGLAKRFEHLYTGAREPVILEKRNEALRLLMSIRDETHRFAHTYHLNVRTRHALSSKLEQVPGVGKKLAGTVLSAVEAARGPLTLDFLKGIKGVGKKRARLIYRALAPGQKTAPDASSGGTPVAEPPA